MNHGHDHLCASCAYFTPDLTVRASDIKSTAGQCHRRPPTTQYVPTQDKLTRQVGLMAQTSFPLVSADKTWCGDHSELVKEREMARMEELMGRIPEFVKRFLPPPPAPFHGLGPGESSFPS